MIDYLELSTDYDNPDIASAFDELSFWSSRFGMLLFDNLAIVRSINVLDVGCGAGFPLTELAQIHGTSCQFTGVDLWKYALERAESKLKAYGLENIRFIKADTSRLPLPDASFDLIVSNLGINNFDDPQAVMNECFRVAKPQARLALTTNVKGHMQEFYDLFREMVMGLGDADCLERLAANENHRGTRKSHRLTVERAGFEITKVIEDKFYLRYLDGSAMMRHSLTRFGFLDGWRDVVGPQVEKEVFAALEDRLNEIADRDGELKMTVPMLYIEARRP